MATIVMHRETEANYVVIGAGFGSWATDKPGFLGFSDQRSGSESVVFVCNSAGEIGGFSPDELMVVSVDGVAVASVLQAPPSSGLPA